MAETAARASNLNPSSVVFQTNGVWRTGDFIRLATAVESMYKAFLAVHLASHELTDIEERLSAYFGMVRDFYEGLPQEQRPPFIPISPPPELFSTVSADQSRYLAFIYDNVYRLAPDEQLTIGSTHLSISWVHFLPRFGGTHSPVEGVY